MKANITDKATLTESNAYKACFFSPLRGRGGRAVTVPFFLFLTQHLLCIAQSVFGI